MNKLNYINEYLDILEIMLDNDKITIQDIKEWYEEIQFIRKYDMFL